MTDTTPADEQHWTPINLVHLSKTDLRHVRAYAEAFAEHKQAHAASQTVVEICPYCKGRGEHFSDCQPAQESVALDDGERVHEDGSFGIRYAAPPADTARQDRIDALESFYSGVKDCMRDTWECRCGRKENWWTDSNADYCTRDARAALERKVRKP